MRTGARDLHSGVFGNAALNATHALMQALGGVLPRDGRLPDALRVGVEPPTDEERASWGQLTLGRRRVAGSRVPCRTTTRAADEFYLRTTAEPSVDVNGILGGKPGLPNTTIPVAAQANFTVRLAPGQDLTTIGAEVERLVREAAPDGAELKLDVGGGAPPGLVVARRAGDPDRARRVRARHGPDGRCCHAAAARCRSCPALADQGIPTILSGIALPESNIHSPNERVLLEYLPLGVDVARELYTRLAA